MNLKLKRFAPGTFVELTDTVKGFRKMGLVTDSGDMYFDLADAGSTPFPIYETSAPEPAGHRGVGGPAPRGPGAAAAPPLHGTARLAGRCQGRHVDDGPSASLGDPEQELRRPPGTRRRHCRDLASQRVARDDRPDRCSGGRVNGGASAEQARPISRARSQAEQDLLARFGEAFESGTRQAQAIADPATRAMGAARIALEHAILQTAQEKETP